MVQRWVKFFDLKFEYFCKKIYLHNLFPRNLNKKIQSQRNRASFKNNPVLQMIVAVVIGRGGGHSPGGWQP